jgi:RimJ/RimL family protein N-acetyltransferase
VEYCETSAISPIFVTERLRIRQLSLDDAAAIYEWRADPEFAAFPRLIRPFALDDIEAFLTRRILEHHAGWSRTWVLDLVKGERAIGYVTLASMTKIVGRYPKFGNGDFGAAPSLEISCALSRKFQAQGLMTESRIPIIAWIFESCSVVARIHSEIEATNIRSVKMNRKLDFDNEALFRD